ncbi:MULTISPECIES: hypothetical protein [unclassified Agrococcus]|uniref:hypothetical protein n=1 Tax=unclassified Agrococcus TaxID=2615065 RepID=UPI003609530E
MHWQAARVILGMVMIFGALFGVIASWWLMHRSCDPDAVFDGAPIDAGSGTVGPRGWPFFGCDATYGMVRGGVEVRAAPFDTSCLFLVIALLGVGVLLHAIRWQPRAA